MDIEFDRDYDTHTVSVTLSPNPFPEPIPPQILGNPLDNRFIRVLKALGDQVQSVLDDLNLVWTITSLKDGKFGADANWMTSKPRKFELHVLYSKSEGKE